MELWPAESTNADPNAGGFICRFPSGTTKQVAWRTGAPITPTLDAAKTYATQLIEALSREAKFDDMERTNWASAVAAIQKIISDWNDKLRERLYSNAPTLQ